MCNEVVRVCHHSHNKHHPSSDRSKASGAVMRSNGDGAEGADRGGAGVLASSATVLGSVAGSGGVDSNCGCDASVSPAESRGSGILERQVDHIR